MNWQARIESDPAICGGRPRIKGTRLTVDLLRDLQTAGWSNAMIMENYPQLVAADLHAVTAFAQSQTDTHNPP
jgi:uncharacterized protein (DUF433 family)